jgi:hypothetical protein
VPNPVTPPASKTRFPNGDAYLLATTRTRRIQALLMRNGQAIACLLRIEITRRYVLGVAVGIKVAHRGLDAGGCSGVVSPRAYAW